MSEWSDYARFYGMDPDAPPPPRIKDGHTLPIETASNIGELLKLLADEPDEYSVRGSIVVWADGEPVRVIGLAPEYSDDG